MSKDGLMNGPLVAGEPLLPEDWCYIHNKSEPATDTTYRVCGECNHVFETPADLESADYDLRMHWHREYNDVVPHRMPADHIYACPECSHDF